MQESLRATLDRFAASRGLRPASQVLAVPARDPQTAEPRDAVTKAPRRRPAGASGPYWWARD